VTESNFAPDTLPALLDAGLDDDEIDVWFALAPDPRTFLGLRPTHPPRPPLH